MLSTTLKVIGDNIFVTTIVGAVVTAKSAVFTASLYRHR